MSELHLIIHKHAYELRLDGRLLARLDGGAEALMAGAGERVREYDMEVAIERAEEWLMSTASKSLHGLELQVHDATGRVGKGLGVEGALTTEDVEQAFVRAHDDVAHGRTSDAEGVAHAVLIRELAHHGRLAGIVLRGSNKE